VGSDLVAVVYIPTFIGWLVAAGINVHAYALLGTGGTLITGGLLITASGLIRALTPVYGAFAFAFFLGALGMALQDAQANTFIASQNIGTKWLGWLHAMYGLGCLISPLVATTIATETSGWEYFYYVLLALGVVSVLLAVIAFKESAFQNTGRKRSPEQLARKPAQDLIAALKLPAVWIISAFYFCYLGAVLTLGGNVSCPRSRGVRLK
jgi:fucose permease